ncbi:hypothetical protein ACQUJS_03440 [Ralstonia pseudosolanacearum]
MRTLILIPILAFGIKTSIAEPIWITTACLQLKMSAWDKLDSQDEYSARYLVTTEGGRAYEAAKTARKKNPDSATVVFPDDFHDISNGLPASMNCASGGKYYWQIYANNRKIDSGHFDFRRAIKQKK